MINGMLTFSDLYPDDDKTVTFGLAGGTSFLLFRKTEPNLKIGVSGSVDNGKDKLIFSQEIVIP